MNGLAESQADSMECTVCGRLSKPGFSQCSVGCNLAAKLPLGDGGPLPISWPLFAALASGFVLFNQLMLWSLFAVKESQGALDMAHRFETSSFVAGSLWLGAALWAWAVGRPKSIGDLNPVFAVLFLVLLARFALNIPMSFSSFFALANLLIGCRLYRGMYALWRSSKKKEN